MVGGILKWLFLMKNKIKIVSGGQTGVDRAGPEAAIELGLEYGGWVPKGRVAEDGIVPHKYKRMKEHTGGYPSRTRANVQDSDATLIIVQKLPLSKGTLLTQKTAERMNKPHLVVCLDDVDVASRVRNWIGSLQQMGKSFVLNIAGPRESNAPGIEHAAKRLLLDVLHDDRQDAEANLACDSLRKQIPDIDHFGGRGWTTLLIRQPEHALTVKIGLDYLRNNHNSLISVTDED